LLSFIIIQQNIIVKNSRLVSGNAYFQQESREPIIIGDVTGDLRKRRRPKGKRQKVLLKADPFLPFAFLPFTFLPFTLLPFTFLPFTLLPFT